MSGATRVGSSQAARLLKRIASARELGILLALLLVIAAAALTNPNFLLSSDGWRDLLLTPSILLLVAVGQAVVIITRNIDLSVSSVVGLTAYLTGRLFIDMPGIPIIAVILAGLLFGALLGAINGALVAFAKVPALVITSWSRAFFMPTSSSSVKYPAAFSAVAWAREPAMS